MYCLPLRSERTCFMDRIASGYSRTVDTDVYEYRGDDYLPMDIDTIGQGGALFRPASSSSDSEQLSSQGTGSQQSLLPQNFYRTSSSQQSSLTSSSQELGVGVSVLFLCQSQNMTGLWHRNTGFCVDRFARGSHSICPLTGVMYVCFVVF